MSPRVNQLSQRMNIQFDCGSKEEIEKVNYINEKRYHIYAVDRSEDNMRHEDQ